MSIKKLWTKLFTKNVEIDEIALHISGATVRHRNPFEDLEVPRNENEISKEFSEKWVIPFYMSSLSNAENESIMTFATASREIDAGIVLELLGEFDWRPRIAGAFFAAINNYKELEDIIGHLLLKSEVCYAGSGYCLALATFATEKSKNYLIKYLEYYLQRKDLWFDQSSAFCALEYLDKAAAGKLFDKWEYFISDKPYWNLEESRSHFISCQETLTKIRNVKALI